VLYILTYTDNLILNSKHGDSPTAPKSLLISLNFIRFPRLRLRLELELRKPFVSRKSHSLSPGSESPTQNSGLLHCLDFLYKRALTQYMNKSDIRIWNESLCLQPVSTRISTR